MSTIFYGETKELVKKQLKCKHKWSGVCIDDISRFRKCLICFCMDRDCTEKEYYEYIEKPERRLMEYIKEIKITVLINTNKASYSKIFDHVKDAEDFINEKVAEIEGENNE